MTGSLGGVRACLLAALVTVGISSCNQTPGSAGDREAKGAAGTPSLCDTSTLKVDNSGWYTDVAGKIWVVGELVNTSGTDRLLPQICVSMRSATGERTERRYAGPIVLRAGESVTFYTLVDNPPAAKDFSLSLAATSLPAERNRALIATIYRDFNASASVRLSPGDKDANIHGILTNTGGLPASNIFVAVGLYNKQGALVGVARGKVSSLDILDPGATLTFTLVSSQLSQTMTSLIPRIFVEGQTVEGSN